MSILVLAYEFNSGILAPTLQAPPTSGQVRFDAVYPWTAVSKVWLSTMTTDGADMRTVLLLLPLGTDVYVQEKDNNANYARFTTTGAPSDHSSWVELPVTYRDAGVQLPNNQAVMAILVTDTAENVGTVPPGGPATPFVRPPWATPVGAWSVLVTRPAFELLTLEQGKLRAGLDWPAGDPRDDLMREWIAAARAKVELDTALALPMQTRDVYLTVTDEGIVPLPSQCTPCLSIEAVTARDGRVLPPSVFRVVGHALWTEVLPVGTEYAVRVIAGWPTVDALIAEAPLLHQAVGLMTAHLATFGRDLAGAGAAVVVPYGYDEAISPHRLMWVT